MDTQPVQASSQPVHFVHSAEHHKPVSVGSWLVTLILFSIPLLGFIFQLYWAFSSSTNPSKKNFARATLVLLLIALAIYLFFAVILGIGLSGLYAPASTS